MGPVNFSQRGLASLCEIHHLVSGFFGRRIKFTQVRVGGDHQMTADVGIAVENYKGVLATIQDEILLVVGRILCSITKDTGVGLRHVGSGRRDIGVSPWAPESFHKKSYCQSDAPA
jgi:hypothetical protein